jgi:ribosomal protein L11 methyltransferase
LSTPAGWRRFSLSVRSRDIEAASAILQNATGVRVCVQEGGDDAPPSSRAKVSAYVRDEASAGIAHAVTRAVREALTAALLRDVIVLSPVLVRDEDWAESWKQFYKPFRIAPGWFIAPSWETEFVAPGRARTLRLDPGMAFGTGQHPTTRAALQFVLEHVRPRVVILDIGCGSGILGIAAAMCGARVFACDIDPIAVAAARANFRVNGVRATSVRRCDGPPAKFPKAQIVTANITADALVRLAPALAASLAPNGVLISAGIHRAGRDDVLRRFAAQGLRRVSERRSGEWSAFVHAKQRSAL